MRKIINGKAYDTSTAKFLTAWENDCSPTDFSYTSESLYIKRTGEYFIHGESNASGKYAHLSYGMYCGGENIIPLTKEEAMEWVERRANDEYESIFGKVGE